MILKRKLRIIPIAILVILAIVYFCNSVVHFQLHKEIKYYKKYFKQRKNGIQGSYYPLAIKQIPAETIDHLYDTRLARAKSSKDKIDWKKLAYVNYVTEPSYLCNTLIMFQSLITHGTQAKLLLLISPELLDPNSESSIEYNTVALIEHIKKLNTDEENPQIIIKSVDTILKQNDSTLWKNSLTKLAVFNQTEYDRIIYMDNDAYLTDSLDELFFIPDYIKFAAPLTYWFLSEKDLKKAADEVENDDGEPTNLYFYLKQIDARIDKGQMIYNHLPSLPHTLFLDSKDIADDIIHGTPSRSPLLDYVKTRRTSKLKFASNLMVIKPSEDDFNRIITEFLPELINKKDSYDMDLINDYLYNLKYIISEQFMIFRKLKSHFTPEVMVLPFSRYGLLTGSIKNRNHYPMIANDILGYTKIEEKTKSDKIDGLNIATKPDDIKISDYISKNKYIHFSDYPLGKPWQYEKFDDFKCVVDKKNSKHSEDDAEMCKVWNSVFELYMVERNICAKV
ncbi:hypothetical protein TPHA_0I00600 [Tetrapisispora phaffii CBS 4417]|uniref:Glucose N-acetyltransferase 1 n=1 Tax=Tetrapisispora phaffii (strain ATCC 24235 / CBS 4417 / NBRC 1672 / NRRL Y-8282 / UCD 70-5) TaxID=1071381 RepID=G8BXD8_TETPH|nr:hypothetical protein TPHA_0I00600 [Tetrapisispora phaffii CBS 4417]CCE64566.1 hypothetical protein TPHA_0I00600 [Tetrapisispora phaffii CBS 4417]